MLWLDQGALYVCDPSNNRIVVLDPRDLSWRYAHRTYARN
jgi:hypothetical protein